MREHRPGCHKYGRWATLRHKPSGCFRGASFSVKVSGLLRRATMISRNPGAPTSLAALKCQADEHGSVTHPCKTRRSQQQGPWLANFNSGRNLKNLFQGPPGHLGDPHHPGPHDRHAGKQKEEGLRKDTGQRCQQHGVASWDTPREHPERDRSGANPWRYKTRHNEEGVAPHKKSPIEISRKMCWASRFKAVPIVVAK